jgi:hypothetical protein
MRGRGSVDDREPIMPSGDTVATTGGFRVAAVPVAFFLRGTGTAGTGGAGAGDTSSTKREGVGAGSPAISVAFFVRGARFAFVAVDASIAQTTSHRV